MIDPVTLLTFVPAALALNLTPGADMMFCLGQGLRAGPRAAWAASAGISAGSMVHVAIAGMGLGAAVQAMPWVFDIIRWAGVAYLLWLAWGVLRQGGGASGAPIQPARHAFRDGMLVNLTNPKVVLFVLAFIPQFIEPAAGSILIQFLSYGLVIAIGGFIVNGVVGQFAGGVGRRLTGDQRLGRVLSRFTAGIFAALALRLALLERT
ncbi:LysE family translocator [Actibacterium sp. XHP0104]|uniref:LysE family translocator n=1 Tax=Actibacterium sp. XHP0104 TaxID=2984335 RepID=UPI0021E7C000|nr:LysE family translocator [Actibacterium sp. XHP0104]MCV2883023.1 LysE family translocator [Actibacterium sp. XHP0104]